MNPSPFRTPLLRVARLVARSWAKGVSLGFALRSCPDKDRGEDQSCIVQSAVAVLIRTLVLTLLLSNIQLDRPAFAATISFYENSILSSNYSRTCHARLLVEHIRILLDDFRELPQLFRGLFGSIGSNFPHFSNSMLTIECGRSDARVWFH